MKELFCKSVELHHFRDIQALALPKLYQFFSVTSRVAVFPLALTTGCNPVRLLIIGASFLGVLGSFGFHHLGPALIMMHQGVHHLHRGLVEGALFGFSGACLHVRSVA